MDSASSKSRRLHGYPFHLLPMSSSFPFKDPDRTLTTVSLAEIRKTIRCSQLPGKAMQIALKMISIAIKPLFTT